MIQSSKSSEQQGRSDAQVTQQHLQGLSSARRKMRKPSLNAQDLLRSGQGTATIANSDFRGVLLDRLRYVAGPGDSGTAVNVDQAGRRSRVTRRHVRQMLTFTASTKPDRQHRPAINDLLAQDLLEKVVHGRHEGDDVLGGKQKYKQSTLNDVARAMTLNPTYAAKDTARFVTKVRSLLPAATTLRKPAAKS